MSAKFHKSEKKEKVREKGRKGGKGEGGTIRTLSLISLSAANGYTKCNEQTPCQRKVKQSVKGKSWGNRGNPVTKKKR